jgi:hypothetical protein
MHVRRLVMLALVTTGCAGILGIDDDQKNAIETLCKCPVAEGYYGSPEACSATLTRKLEVVTEGKRAEWMQNFASQCANAPCATALTCLGFPPTCIDRDESCGVDGQVCCSKTCDDNGKCT